MKLKYIFGPVLSRRLGISLGIDLIPYKTCSLDCIYCECGKTSILKKQREAFVSAEKVIEELDGYLSNKPKLDYITFAGSGEPTLYKGLDIIINFLKENYSEYKIALISNSTLFQDQNLLEEIQNVDLIIPSIDAVSEDIFKKINRPIKGVTANDITSGLINLRKNYHGIIWLEIFIVPGINDSLLELKKFIQVIKQIKVDKVQLNRLDRTGTEVWVKSSKKEDLNQIAKLFKETIKDIQIDIL